MLSLRPKIQPYEGCQGQWALPREFKGYQSYGYFYCPRPRCRKVWISSRATKNYRQACKRCKQYYFALYYWKNYYRRMDSQEKVLKDNHIPHMKDLCQACKAGVCGTGKQKAKNTPKSPPKDEAQRQLPLYGLAEKPLFATGPPPRSNTLQYAPPVRRGDRSPIKDPIRTHNQHRQQSRQNRDSQIAIYQRPASAYRPPVNRQFDRRPQQTMRRQFDQRQRYDRQPPYRRPEYRNREQVNRRPQYATRRQDKREPQQLGNGQIDQRQRYDPQRSYRRPEYRNREQVNRRPEQTMRRQDRREGQQYGSRQIDEKYDRQRNYRNRNYRRSNYRNQNYRSPNRYARNYGQSFARNATKPGDLKLTTHLVPSEQVELPLHA